MNLSKFLGRWFSRKFLMTLAGALALYSVGQYTEMVILLLGYIGVNGASEVAAKYKSGTLTASDVETVMSHNDENEPDTSKIVTGNKTDPAPTPLFNEEPKE